VPYYQTFYTRALIAVFAVSLIALFCSGLVAGVLTCLALSIVQGVSSTRTAQAIEVFPDAPRGPALASLAGTTVALLTLIVTTMLAITPAWLVDLTLFTGSFFVLRSHLRVPAE
jgi:hypothetical protein